jgi:murein DD-endopeptidase MepM/ murein hydrolase activator NlpD
MMKKPVLFLCVLLFISIPAYLQPFSFGGGEFQQPRQQCVTERQYSQIYEQLTVAEKRLKNEGKIPAALRSSQIQLSFPLKQSAAYSYPSFYGISNYVDHNVSVPDQISDYNCGARSYDLSSGYNHQGIDYFLWPFDNLMQQRNQVEVVAAADGVILQKSDGNDDQNCSFCSNCQWNAVFLRHNDGSVTWYGHLKKNSLTTKAEGSTVSKGEYLGVVGSSGISSGPHLHFEVYKSSFYNRANLIDPYGGPCNLLNGSNSWWDQQPSYYQPRITRIQTQSAATNFGSCPVPETTYEVNEVVQGQTVYFTTYYSDQQAGTTANWQITRSDNILFRNFTQNLSNTFNASWWWYSFTIPSNAPLGIWNFQVTYQGKTVQYPFRVSAATSINSISGQKQVVAYPNPFKDQLWLNTMGTLTDCSISLYNANGSEVYRKEGAVIQGSPFLIDQLDLSKGLYWLIVRNNGKVIFRKMIQKG